MCDVQLQLLTKHVMPQSRDVLSASAPTPKRVIFQPKDVTVSVETESDTAGEESNFSESVSVDIVIVLIVFLLSSVVAILMNERIRTSSHEFAPLRTDEWSTDTSGLVSSELSLVIFILRHYYLN